MLGKDAGTMRVVLGFKYQAQDYMRKTRSSRQKPAAVRLAVHSLFTPSVRVLLQNMDHRIKLYADRPHDIYESWRKAMERICPKTDSFFVGFFNKNETITYPYSYDEGKYDEPETITYRKDGLCAWLRSNGATYRYKQDDGLLFKDGQPFGNVERRSLDAIEVPLRDLDSEAVIGVGAILSYTANAFDDETVAAFEWLAHSVEIALKRAKEDRADRLSLGLDDLDLRWDPVTTLAEYFAQEVHLIRTKLERIFTSLPTQSAEIRSEIASLISLCERIPTTLSNVARTSDIELSDAWAQLSPAERRVAKLVGHGHSNRAISKQLNISESTVKKHITKILHAFGVSQRASVVERLRGWSSETSLE